MRPQRGYVPRNAGPEHRINQNIRVPSVRVIDPEGNQLGIMAPADATRLAAEQGLDLVEVAPTAEPPVCRIMDYGRFRYEKSKKSAASKSARVVVKTIRLRPKTDVHDLETKVNRATQFLQKGERVQFVMRLRGRENAYPDRWLAKMNEVVQGLGGLGQVVGEPTVDGRTITATIEPRPS